MPPSPTATFAEFYGVKKANEVMAYIYDETSQQQIELQKVIDSLSVQPRPEGHQPMGGSRPGLTQLPVSSTDPSVILLYDIDDKKCTVEVLSIMPIRFQ
jgi:hypothetical protein